MYQEFLQKGLEKRFWMKDREHLGDRVTEIINIRELEVNCSNKRSNCGIDTCSSIKMYLFHKAYLTVIITIATVTKSIETCA